MCRGQNHSKNWIMGKFRVEPSIFADKGSPLPVDFPINQYPNPLEHFWPGSFTRFPVRFDWDMHVVDIVVGESTQVDAGYLARFPVLQPYSLL